MSKSGFVPLQRNGPSPPAYDKFNSDVLLERSEIDEANGTSDRENDFPPDFLEFQPLMDEMGRINDALRIPQPGGQITMCSLPPHPPPRYEHPSGDPGTSTMRRNFDMDFNTEMYIRGDSAEQYEGQQVGETGHRGAVISAEANDALTRS